MQPNSQHIPPLRNCLLKSWDIPGPDVVIPETDAYAQLRGDLIQAIAQLLNAHPERLSQIMYRLDVDEEKFRRALAHPNAPEHIADLVLEREWQRLRFRQQYSSSHASDTPTDG